MSEVKARHKYLNKLGIPSDNLCIFNTCETANGEKTNRTEYFKKQRTKYGFDERETWALNYTLISWLYSHLKWYVKHAPVNFDFHKFEIPVLEEIPEAEREYAKSGAYAFTYQREVVQERTQGEAMDIALEYMETYLLSEKEEPPYEPEAEIRGYECARCALKIVACIFDALWW